MRTLFTVATIGLCTATGLAQNETRTDTTAEAQEAITDAAQPIAAAQAEQLLQDVVKSYTGAGALSDAVTMKSEITGLPEEAGGDMSEEIEVAVVLDRAAGNARYSAQGMVVTAVDGQLYLEADGVKKKFLQREIEKDLATTMTQLFGRPLSFHFALTNGATVDDLTTSLNVGDIQNLKVTGYDETTSEDGVDRTIVTMTGDNEGVLKIHVDPQTKLIAKTSTEFKPQYSMGDATMVVNVTSIYDTKLLDTLAAPIAFDPAGRTAVSDFMDLQPTPVEAGEQAPDFTLTSSHGGDVKLSDLRGNVVVIDFWATWCGPCKMGLPLLEKFYTWTKDTGNNVKVYAVNVWERASSNEQRKDMAMKYWKSQEFTMPTLFDFDGSVVGEYGVSGIPTTVIIAPDGTVSAVHVGFDPNMVETLKSDAHEALEKGATAG